MSLVKPYPRAEDLNPPPKRYCPKALSLHQPYASLLAHGVMRGEGRSWPSEFRGRLWICATSRQPTETEIRRMEKRFTSNYKRLGYEVPPMPKTYPTGCIVGRVNVTEVLTQDEAKEKITEGTLEPYYASCGSPYVFVCRDFERLRKPHPVKGRPKIYNIPVAFDKRARQGLVLLRDPKRKFVPIKFPANLHVVTMDNLHFTPQPSPVTNPIVVEEKDYDYQPLPLAPPQQVTMNALPLTYTLTGSTLPNAHSPVYGNQGVFGFPSAGVGLYPVSPGPPTVSPGKDTGLELLRKTLEAYQNKSAESADAQKPEEDATGAGERFESQLRESVATVMRRKFIEAIEADPDLPLTPITRSYLTAERKQLTTDVSETIKVK